MVAVGTAVARRPPHGSRRAELPHRALASDQTPRDGSPSRARPGGSLGRSSGRATPSLCGTGSDRPVLPSGTLFGQAPSLHPLRRAALAALCSRVSRVLWACPTSRTRASPSYPDKGSRRGPVPKRRSGAGSPGFRVRCLRACVGSSTPRDPHTHGDGACWHGLGRLRIASASRTWTFRGSMASPHVPLSTLRRHPHECHRMTRGRCDLPSLHRKELSSSTPHRLWPAHSQNVPTYAFNERVTFEAPRFPNGHHRLDGERIVADH